MPAFSHDGLELWYGTPDAPAPVGGTVARDRISITVAAKPASPANRVTIHYRVDDGLPQELSTVHTRTDHEQRTQYFTAAFPTIWEGDSIQYIPVLSCAGRRNPDPQTAATFPTQFRLVAAPVAMASPQRQQRKQGAAAKYPAPLEYLVTSRVSIDHQPEMIGLTPAGYVVNWPPTSGTLIGPAFNATVHPEGEHEMIVRPDGVGMLTVRVTVETDDAALISLRYSGVVELGADGFERLGSGRWPESAPVKIAPRLLTAHPKYVWLNRLQCLGVGEVRAADQLYAYDLYAIR